MQDWNELADRFVAVWNQTDALERRRLVASLWAEGGAECTPQKRTAGHAALEQRVASSHEKNVRDAGHCFESMGDAKENHGVVTFHWRMTRGSDGSIAATGWYVLLLDAGGRIASAHFFSAG